MISISSIFRYCYYSYDRYHHITSATTTVTAINLTVAMTSTTTVTITTNSLRVPRAYGDQGIHPCPNHNSVRVPRAYGDQSIHAQPRFPFAFQEHTVNRASMPKPIPLVFQAPSIPLKDFSLMSAFLHTETG